MSVSEFLAEFADEDFPHEHGPWQSFGNFDPPFKRWELRNMRKLNVIELDEKRKRFRLTLDSIAYRPSKAA